MTTSSRSTLWVILAVVLLLLTDRSPARGDLQVRDSDIGRSAAWIKHLMATVSRVRRQTGSEYLLEDHNEFRREVGASNMNKLYWNDTLALYAAQWAQECRWEHGQPNGLPDNRYGQNLYASSLQPFSASRGVEQWFNESYYYTYDTGDCEMAIHPDTGQPVVCGHYTQMVWATTREVGCAVHLCPNIPGLGSNFNYLVCNYYPVGNFVGIKPFRLGPACTECYAGQCDNGLCDWRMTRTECEECTVPGYTCIQCPTSYPDTSSSRACSGDVNQLSLEPGNGSTVFDVTFSVTSTNNFFMSTNLEVELRANTGYWYWILRVNATRIRDTKAIFTAPAIPESYASTPWNLYLHYDSEFLCDLKKKIAFFGEPSVSSIEPRAIFIAGGTTLTVNGDNFYGVNIAQIVVHMTYTKDATTSMKTFKGPCQAASNGVLTCTAPAITLPPDYTPASQSRRRKRQSSANDDVLNDEILEFSLDLELDGDVSKTPPPPGGPDACGGVCVYYNPEIEPFFPEEQDFTKSVTIEGKRLNLGARMSDYKINVGLDGVCIVKSLLENAVHCQPPSSEPKLIRDGQQRDGAPRIQVEVGFLKFHVGYLRYPSINWILYGGIAGGAVVGLLLIGCVCYCLCCKSSDSSRHASRGARHDARDGYLNPAYSRRPSNDGYLAPVSKTYHRRQVYY